MSDVFSKYRSIVDDLRALDHVSFPATLARCRKGDETAKRRISEASLRFVLRVAEEWSNLNFGKLVFDVIEESNAALWNAIDNFSGWRIDDFESFLKQRIRKHLENTYAGRPMS